MILDSYEISKIKWNINASLKGKEFYEIYSIISEKNNNIITKFFDLRYNIIIKENNNNDSILELREEKIILIEFINSIELLNPQNTDEYFIYITLKLTQKVNRPYKIMIISCLDKTDDIPKLVCLIALIYLDTISYTKIFSYLKDNYLFS